MLQLLEQWDLLRFASEYARSLQSAAETFGKRADERAWLQSASTRLAAALEGTEGALEQGFRLPELSSVREEIFCARRDSWVDSLEHLLAGIAFCAGARSPL